MVEFWTQNNKYESTAQKQLVVPKFEELPADKQAAITEGPGWVVNSAEQELADFQDINEFRCHEEAHAEQWGSNNFRLYFGDGFVSEVYRQAKAYQRFSIVFPEMAEEIRLNMRRSEQKPDANLWEQLLDAYSLMKQLVDTHDDHVTKDGQVQRLFLTI